MTTNSAMQKFRNYQMQSLIGVFIGYLSYYLVRNNFIFSTPYIKEQLHLSNTQIGMLSSSMLIMYGFSKGFMSVLADKSNPKYFMALGLFLCIIVNFFMGFTYNFYLFVLLVALLGLFQGMGVGPSIITVGYWFPRAQRGRASTIWNVSHNLGGGLVAPIVGAGISYLGVEHWRLASYFIPGLIAIVGMILVLILVKKRPQEEGFPLVETIYNEKSINTNQFNQSSSNESSFQIFYKYVLKNPNSWWIVGVDVFIYMVRFGMITWIPLYLLNIKGFSKAEMGTTFLLFEFAAIPSSLIAGYLVDKLFKGKVMVLPMICLVIIFLCVLGYVNSSSLVMITIFSTITGCLVYVPQSMVAVQAMEVIPNFALGSAVGLRGFMSYIVGSSLGTTLFGFIVDRFGWDSGFYAIMVGTVICFVFCFLSHRGLLKIESQNKVTQ